jgi:hypothetical protein
MGRLWTFALAAASLVLLAGCGGPRFEVRRTPDGEVIYVRRSPLEETADVMRQINVITAGVNSGARTSNIKYFDR